MPESGPTEFPFTRGLYVTELVKTERRGAIAILTLFYGFILLAIALPLQSSLEDRAQELSP